MRFLLAYHSYLVKYNGLLASRFFSSREITLCELVLFNSMFECNSVASTRAEKDETSLQVFLSRTFKLYTLFLPKLGFVRYLISESRIHITKVNSEFVKDIWLSKGNRCNLPHLSNFSGNTSVELKT